MKLILKRVTQEPKPRKLKYLVTGTGRCGTMYIAQALSSVGVPCSHEAIFTFGGIEYALLKLAGGHLENSAVASDYGIWLLNPQHIEAEASFMAAPFLNHPCLSETKIIHIVRHPLKVISSFLEAFDYFQKEKPEADPYQNFIYSHVSELSSLPDPISRACFFYQRWNEMIEMSSFPIHRVEDSIEPILDKIGVSSKKVLENRRANTRSNTHKSYGVEDIPKAAREQLKKFAARYGYLLEEPWYDFTAHTPEKFSD
jgi:hypothetical protein